MATDIWFAGSPVRDHLNFAVANWHPELADIIDRIMTVFREPAQKSGGRVVLGNARKASPMLKAVGKQFAQTDFIFVLEIAAEEWQHLDDTKRLALIDHLLCSCKAEEAEDDSEIKYSIAKPDIQMFSANVGRFGVWVDLQIPEEDSEKEKESENAAAAVESTVTSKSFADRAANFVSSEPVNVPEHLTDVEESLSSSEVDDALMQNL